MGHLHAQVLLTHPPCPFGPHVFLCGLRGTQDILRDTSTVLSPGRKLL